MMPPPGKREIPESRESIMSCGSSPPFRSYNLPRRGVGGKGPGKERGYSIRRLPQHPGEESSLSKRVTLSGFITRS